MKKIFYSISSFFKKLGRRRFENIALLSAAALIIADFGYHAVSGFSSSVETVPARVGTSTVTLDSEAYVVRDEALVFSDMTGSVMTFVESGGKVKASDEVAGIYYHSAGQEIIYELEELIRARNTIEDAQNACNDKVGALIDARITAMNAEISGALSDGALKRARTLTDSLQYLLSYREIRDSNLDPSELISALDLRIEAVESKLGEPVEKVLSPDAGWFYSETDGFENVTDTEKVKNMDFDALSGLFGAEAEQYRLPWNSYQSESDGAGNSAGGDAPDEDYSTPCVVGKLVSSHIRLIVTVVPSESARFLSLSKSYTARLGNTDQTLTLERAVPSSDGTKTALVFSCVNTASDDPEVRICDISVVMQEYSGFRIPTRAVTYLDGICGVYILRGFVVEFREISVLASVGNTVIADKSADAQSGSYRALAQNDNIIVGGDDLYVGKIIK